MIYYITKKTSETGQKLEAVNQKMKEIYLAQKAMAEKYGFSQWAQESLTVAGPISVVRFPDGLFEMSAWKKGIDKNTFAPKNSHPEGKKIAQEFSQLPKVRYEDLNEAVGFNGDFLQVIGFSRSHTEYFGFVLRDEWEYTPPADCEEVTRNHFRTIFPEKKDGDN